MILSDKLEKEFRLNDFQKKALNKMGISTVEDLLYYFPVRYGNTSQMKTVESLVKGDDATVFGKISGLKTSKAWVKKIPMSEAVVTDDTGKMKIVWFNQPYIAKMIHEGQLVRVEGRVSEKRPLRQAQGGELYMSNPKIEVVSTLPTAVGDSLFINGKTNDEDIHVMYPVYPESKGVTSYWLYHAIQKIMSRGILDTVTDPIPEDILKKYNLPGIKTAFIWIHTPKKEDDALSARKRFAFQEIFFIQLLKQRDKKLWSQKSSFRIETSKKDIENFVKRFPFKPTESQTNAIDSIVNDLKRGYPMSRLLEGDVGSGKTAVAATCIYAIALMRPNGKDYGNLQTAYMVPTEILAKQHYENFISYFQHLPIKIGLITGSGCQIFPSKSDGAKPTKISRAQLLKWVANGEVPILIGTHALIQKSVKFKHLAFVVIDEQHRFGTNQRGALVRRQISGQDADETRTEKNPNEQLLYKDLTYRIREIIFKIRKELGSGHKETIYQKAFAEECKQSKLSFSQEKRIPVLYNKKEIGLYIPDFVIEEKIIIEFKALPFIRQKEKKQLWSYLKGSNYKLALLINFGNERATIDRVIYDTARSASGPHPSASIPHLLSMTATPIPRTLALTIYGDLDLTLLDQMPHGRKPIITKIILPTERDVAYEQMREELKAGRQLYVICPRIDEPDPSKELAVIAKSVKMEAERLNKEVFPEYMIDILHSKMTPAEKESVMDDFSSGKTQILVATSVVEVGVNVPNATMIVIEGAERFGLAQLHQLRGRVIRSNHQAYCFVFAESKTQKTKGRLKALITAKNGFELAEFDLTQRGAGELYGRKQWGISDLAMEAIKNIKMVEASRTEAIRIVEEDEDFDSYPTIKEYFKTVVDKIHFE